MELSDILAEIEGWSMAEATAVTSLRELYEFNLTDVKPTPSQVREKFGILAQVAAYPMEPKAEKRCGVPHPFGFKCTRKKGHDGEDLLSLHHEAHIEPGVAACPRYLAGAVRDEQTKSTLASYHRNAYKDAIAASWPEKWYGLFYNGQRCLSKKTSPSGYTVNCNLYRGHTGPHQSMYSEFVAKGEPWTDNEAAAVAEKPAISTPSGTLGEKLKATDISSQDFGVYKKKVWQTFADAGLPAPPAQYLQASVNICQTKAPNGWMICTREAGHDGPHEAHLIGTPCGPTWMEGEYQE